MSSCSNSTRDDKCRSGGFLLWEAPKEVTPEYVIDTPFMVTVPVSVSEVVLPVCPFDCIGLNYPAHTVEMGHGPNKKPPLFFQKNPETGEITLTINGVSKQRSDLNQVTSYLSDYFELASGEIIQTIPPPGVRPVIHKGLLEERIDNLPPSKASVT